MSSVNKLQLIDLLAEKTMLPKKDIESVLESFENLVIEYLLKGEEVTLTGFGTWLAKTRASRMGVNPQKPEEKIRIPEVVVPKFRAGKRLKDALKKPATQT